MVWLKCKKGLSVLKAMAAPSLPVVSKCGAQCHWLWTRPHNNGTNLLKLDRVQNEAVWVILRTTKDTPIETMRFMLDFPPMQTRQKVEQVKAYFSAIENRHNPLHEAVKDAKGCRRVGHVLDGSSRGLNTASMPADRAQANQGVGKVPKPIPASPWDTPARKLGKALLRLASRQNSQRSSFSFKKTTRPYSVHWCLSHQRPVIVVLHCQAWCS